MSTLDFQSESPPILISPAEPLLLPASMPPKPHYSPTIFNLFYLDNGGLLLVRLEQRGMFCLAAATTLAFAKCLWGQMGDRRQREGSSGRIIAPHYGSPNREPKLFMLDMSASTSSAEACSQISFNIHHFCTFSKGKMPLYLKLFKLGWRRRSQE